VTTPSQTFPDTVNRDTSSDTTAALRAAWSAPLCCPPPVQPSFAVVEFWGRLLSTQSGPWIRVGATPTFTVADNGNSRVWTYQVIWNPNPSTAPFPNPSTTWFQLVAVGVSSNGVVTATPLNNNLWVRVP
jgi:hypothetical protein